MPFTRLFYHLIWSTKKRLPLITPDLEESLFPYLGGKADELDCKVLAVNGWEDHIHLVIEITPKLSVAEAVKRLKGASSHEFPELYWQRGYGALTVSERNLNAALEYVNRQKEHHTQQTAIAKFEHCDDNEDEAHSIQEEAAAYKVDEKEYF